MMQTFKDRNAVELAGLRSWWEQNKGNEPSIHSLLCLLNDIGYYGDTLFMYTQKLADGIFENPKEYMELWEPPAYVAFNSAMIRIALHVLEAYAAKLSKLVEGKPLTEALKLLADEYNLSLEDNDCVHCICKYLIIAIVKRGQVAKVVH